MAKEKRENENQKAGRALIAFLLLNSGNIYDDTDDKEEGEEGEQLK